MDNGIDISGLAYPACIIENDQVVQSNDLYKKISGNSHNKIFTSEKYSNITIPFGTNIIVSIYIENESQQLKTRIKSIAHDFNNFLTNISASVDAIKTKSRDNNLEKYFNNIEINIKRAIKLTESFLPKADKSFLFDRIKIDNVITEVCNAIQNILPPDIKLTKNLPSELPYIMGDQDELFRAFYNILINAKEAISGPGTISVAVSQIKKAESAPDYICIELSDSGSGINEDKLDKIFDLNFSTKQKGRESGIGLFFVKETIHNHQGEVSVVSKPDMGTTFRILLPCIKKSGVSEFKPKVLFVDDEDIIRELVTELLEENNFVVTACSDAEQALIVFNKNPQFDIAIIDRKLPGINGIELIGKIRNLNENIKIILATGSQNDESFEMVETLNIQKVLHKPYNFEQMVYLLNQL